jgi:hypothetical protein
LTLRRDAANLESANERRYTEVLPRAGWRQDLPGRSAAHSQRRDRNNIAIVQRDTPVDAHTVQERAVATSKIHEDNAVVADFDASVWARNVGAVQADGTAGIATNCHEFLFKWYHPLYPGRLFHEERPYRICHGTDSSWRIPRHTRQSQHQSLPAYGVRHGAELRCV